MKKKNLLTLIIALLLLSILVSCTGQTDNGKNKNNSDKKAARIMMFSNEWHRYDGADKDSVWELIEKKTNTVLELSGAPMNGYMEKINIMVNTNETPDIFFYLPEENETYAKWAEQGMLLDLGEYVKDDSTYPNLYRILYDDNYKNLKYGGKHTLIARTAPQNNWAVYIRQDWLDNLGLRQPETIEDLANVMKAFTEQDPDGNGKNDTYGITSSKEFFWFMPIFAAWCPQPGWNYTADGKSMEYVYYTDGYKEYLRYMSDLYAKGYIVKDYYTKTDDMKIEDFATGKAGIMIHNADSHVQNIMSKVRQASPNAKIEVIAPPKGPAGSNMHGWGGWWGGYSISADCKDLEAALRLLDYLLSEEGTMLRYYGIEGTHYTRNDDGSIHITTENVEARLNEVSDRFPMVELDDGDEMPYGEYAWGPWLGLLYKLENGRIRTYTDFTFYKYKDLASKAAALSEEHVRLSDMNNIAVSDTDFLRTVKKLKDNANIYTTNIIIGEMELEAGWKDYMDKAIAAGYEDACKKAFNITRELAN